MVWNWGINITEAVWRNFASLNFFTQAGHYGHWNTRLGNLRLTVLRTKSLKLRYNPSTLDSCVHRGVQHDFPSRDFNRRYHSHLESTALTYSHPTNTKLTSLTPETVKPGSPASSFFLYNDNSILSQVEILWVFGKLALQNLRHAELLILHYRGISFQSH